MENFDIPSQLRMINLGFIDLGRLDCIIDLKKIEASREDKIKLSDESFLVEIGQEGNGLQFLNPKQTTELKKY